MSNDEFRYCPFCARQFYGTAFEGTSCPSCHKELPGKGSTRVHVNIAGLSPAVNAQAGAAASMLTALAQAQALPLVSLLESWWENLTETDKNEFVKALLARAMYMVRHGTIDGPLGEAVLERFDNAALAKRLEQFIEKGEADDELSRAVARIVSGRLDESRSHLIYDEMKDTVRKIASACVMNEREVIESAVRDKMPEIEEMTREIVQGIAADMADEVRARMRRKD